VGDDLAMMT